MGFSGGDRADWELHVLIVLTNYELPSLLDLSTTMRYAQLEEIGFMYVYQHITVFQCSIPYIKTLCLYPCSRLHLI